MKKLLILGSSGLIGSRVVELLSPDYELITPSSSELDLTVAGNFEKYITNYPKNELIGIPIINFVGFTDVDGAEKQKDDKKGLAFQLNASRPGEIAEWCADMSTRFIHISSEYVFDGTKEDAPYTEQDPPNPLGWYGKTKLQADEWIQESGCDHVILRISMPYRSNFEKKKDLGRVLYERLKNGQPIQAISDSKISPIFVDDLAEKLKAIIEKPEIKGVYNVGPSDFTTPEGFVKMIAKKAGLDDSQVSTISFEDYWKDKVANGAAKRPKNSWLDSKKLANELGIEIKSIESQLKEWLKI